MSYVVLARKWRPQSFEDLVGQGHVSTTLANAIAKNRVAHAFLFTGVRGVGKTTSARILAKSLNCEKGPTAKPCQVCAPCKEITAGSDVDVQEIDGASYTGVDDVRKLQESLPYRPSRDRFKIFVVDEVHMLSNNAWNAFLKTLEEPPPHVKFIFATTEVHKIPVTILSRCQRYDFKMISAQAVASRLRYVLEQEGIAFEDGALSILAREAAGSMRDGMSLLDQVIAWVGVDSDKLTAEGVARVLGVADRSVLHGLAAALVDGDAEKALRTVGDLTQQGYDLPHVARDFLALLRDLVVAKVAADPTGLLDLADSEIADVKALVARAEGDDLARLHQGFSRSFDDITRSGQPRAALEMTLVRLARRPPLLPVDELLRRLGDLERRLMGGGSSAPPGATGPGRSMQGAPPARSGYRASSEGHGASSGGNAGGNAANVPPPSGSAPTTAMRSAESSGNANPFVAGRPSTSGNANSLVNRSPSTSGNANSLVNRSPSTSGDPNSLVTGSASTSGDAGKRPSSPPPARAGMNGAAPKPPALPPNVNPKDVAALRAIIALVREKRPPLASVLEHAALVRISEDALVLGYEATSFLGKQAQDPSAIAVLRAAAAAHLGGQPNVSIEALQPGTAAVTIAQLDSVERKERLDSAKRAIVEHPLVTAAIELLGAELRDVRLGHEDALAAEQASVRR
jgi:DNA polymerase-3 subunit gamma/tau